MKKVLAAAATVGTFLTLVTLASAQIDVGITPPENAGINPSTSVGVILSNVLFIIFVVAALAVLFMLIVGAFKWITSGGDKENVKAARGQIVNALIGLAILALAFLITRVVGQILNIDILNLRNLPTLQTCPPDQSNVGGRCVNNAPRPARPAN